MRDNDVRVALRAQLLHEHAAQLDGTLFVDELSLCGASRVDIAVVNSALSGFELKSARDTLRRLPSQVDTYSKVLDYSTLVVAEGHVAGALPLLPSWWGVTVVRWDGTSAELEIVRAPLMNPGIQPSSLAQLLWRDETYRAFEQFDAAHGMRNKPKRVLWDQLVEAIDLATLRRLVRENLKARTGWRTETRTAQFGRELASDGATLQS